MEEEHLIIALLDGRPVTPSEVGRGRECGCICAGCGAPLVARKGSIRRHHFAHVCGQRCADSSLESLLHRLAKRRVCEPGFRLNLPRYLYRPPRAARPLEDPERPIVIPVQGVREAAIVVAEGAEELKLGNVRADAVIWVGRPGARKQLIVEIAVQHPCGRGKRARIRRTGIPAIEIHLEQLAEEVRGERLDCPLADALDRALADATNIDWLYHPGEERLRARLARWIRRQRADRRATRRQQRGGGIGAQTSLAGPGSATSRMQKCPVAVDADRFTANRPPIREDIYERWVQARLARGEPMPTLEDVREFARRYSGPDPKTGRQR